MDVGEATYIFLRQSGTQLGKLKVDLQNDFTTRNNHYPKTRHQTLHLLDKYSKSALSKSTNSEGASFAQGGGSDGNDKAILQTSCPLSLKTSLLT